jgi:hypothetical protein
MAPKNRNQKRPNKKGLNTPKGKTRNRGNTRRQTRRTDSYKRKTREQAVVITGEEIFSPALYRRPVYGSFGGLASSGVKAITPAVTGERLVVNNYLLNEAQFYNAGDPALGDDFKEIMYLLAKINNADRNDPTLIQALADYSAELIPLITNARYRKLIEKLCPGTLANASDTHVAYPYTPDGMLHLDNLLMKIPAVPEFILPIIDLYTTPIQIWGSSPNQRELPHLLLPAKPILSTSYTLANQNTILADVMTKKSGLFMASELKLKMVPMSLEILAPRRPVPIFSDLGQFWRTHMHWREDTADVETQYGFNYGVSGDVDIMYDERLGVADLHDAALFASEDDDGRASREMLISSIATDKSSLFAFTENASGYTHYGNDSGLYMMDSICRGLIGTSVATFREYTKRIKLGSTVFTETYWNNAFKNYLTACLLGSVVNVQMHPLLSEVRSLAQLKLKAEGTALSSSKGDTTKTDLRDNRGQGMRRSRNVEG